MVEDNNMTKEEAIKIAEELLTVIYCHKDDIDSMIFRATIATAKAEKDTAVLVEGLKATKNFCEKLIEALK